MVKKDLIRKRYLKKRKKKYLEINEKFFTPLKKLFKEKIKFNKKLIFSLYFPSSYEVNVLKILDIDFFSKQIFSLPVIEENNSMNFYRWKKYDILYVNKYGIVEPAKFKKIVPDIVLVPMLAFDKYKNRLGYGKGFYDKYLKKHNKINKKIVSVGVAFSFQKYHKLPVNKNDFKLDYIITEKGIF